MSSPPTGSSGEQRIASIAITDEQHLSALRGLMERATPEQANALFQSLGSLAQFLDSRSEFENSFAERKADDNDDVLAERHSGRAQAFRISSVAVTAFSNALADGILISPPERRQVEPRYLPDLRGTTLEKTRTTADDLEIIRSTGLETSDLQVAFPRSTNGSIKTWLSGEHLPKQVKTKQHFSNIATVIDSIHSELDIPKEEIREFLRLVKVCKPVSSSGIKSEIPVLRLATTSPEEVFTLARAHFHR